ncbi:DUF1127 domain-containing protein [Paracoccus ravus]|uniref:DUF1127 domain-containing protein n=1 Tax=Paracoccus ravus TaxID=2447760 RepID=UPI00106EBFC0|nr:DUF1127 domain-containing protein [Paracoccus ravus]
MNAAVLNPAARAGHGQIAQVGLARRIKAFFVARQVERRTFDELDMTSDRELADLGLSRHDVARLARLAGRQAAEKYLAA